MENRTDFYESRHKPGMHIALKILIGIALGLACGPLGVLVPLVGALCVLMPAAVMLIAYGCLDLPGFAACALVYEAGMLVAGEAELAVTLLVAVLIPSVWMIHSMMKGRRFPARLFSGIGVQLLGIVAGLFLLTLFYGKDLAERYGAMFTDLMHGLPEELQNPLLSNLFAVMMTSSEGLTTEEMLTQFSSFIVQAIKLVGPGVLLVTGALNMVVGVIACGKIRTHRMLTDGEKVSIASCRMPGSITLGLILFTVLGFVLASAYGAVGQVIQTTVLIAVSFAAEVQYFASITDKLSQIPISRGRKILFGVLITVLLAQIIPIYGILSMLFGKKGLISSFFRERMRNREE